MNIYPKGFRRRQTYYPVICIELGKERNAVGIAVVSIKIQTTNLHNTSVEWQWYTIVVKTIVRRTENDMCSPLAQTLVWLRTQQA